MDLNLKDKVFIITGGARGIGAAISKLIALEGGKVVIAGLDEVDNNKMVNEITLDKGIAAAITVDLSGSNRVFASAAPVSAIRTLVCAYNLI
ncbi:MAG: SDR family NAD(P)-dependent oxidoreductase [Pseudomonadota bacterium]